MPRARLSRPKHAASTRRASSRTSPRERDISVALENAALTDTINTLIADTELERPLDAEKVSLPEKLISQAGSDASKLQDLIDGLKNLSAANPKVDALVRLYTLRDQLARLRQSSKSRLEVLTLEDAQLN